MYQDINLYLAGEWIPASQGGTRPVLNPATEEPVGTIADATADDLNKALSAADRGVAVWRNTGPWDRASKLRRTADLIRERVDTIATVMSLETGKPLAEAKGETGAAADQFEWYSEETKRIYG